MTIAARSGSSVCAARVHLLERDRREQLRQLPVVVEPETEELRGLKEVGDAGVGLERARHRTDQELPRLGQFLLGQPLCPKLRQLVVDRRDRPIDVGRR